MNVIVDILAKIDEGKNFKTFRVEHSIEYRNTSHDNFCQAPASLTRPMVQQCQALSQTHSR